MTQGVHTGIRFLFRKTKIIKKFKNKIMKIFSKILNYLKPQKRRISVLILGGFLTFLACNNDAADLTNPIDMPSGGDALVSLKYTAEVMSHVKTDAQNGKLTGLEEIKAVPKTKRSEIAMNVYQDGTCDMTMKELEPKFQPIKYAHLTPPSNRPKGVFTRVERNGKVHVFDKDNKEISVFDMSQKIDLSKWVEIIKNDTTASTQADMVSYIFGNKTGGVKAMMEDAKRNGGTIKDNGDGTFLVTIGKLDNGLDTRGADKTFTESVVNPSLNIVKAAAIFDKKSNKMLSKMAYTYKSTGNAQELTHIYLESLNPNSSSRRQEKMITITEFSNVSLKINR
jgi:hypothetical protein